MQLNMEGAYVEVHTHKYHAIVYSVSFILIIVPLYHNTDNSTFFLLIISYPLLVFWIVSLPLNSDKCYGSQSWPMSHEARLIN